MLENVKRFGLAATVAGLLTVVGFVGAGAAMATPADPVAGAFTSMQDKIVTYGAAIVGLVVASAVIFLGVKYIRKGLAKA